MSCLNAKCYPTILSLPLHKEPYIPIFHYISCLTDHHIQMLKKRKCGSLPHFQFSRCYVLCLRGIYFSFLYFSFLIIWKDLRQLLLVLVIFILQQKNKQRNKNNSILWYKVCCDTIHEITLGLLWHQPMGKTCGLRRGNGTMIHTFWKTKYCRQHALVTYVVWVLKVVKVQRLE